MSCKYLLIYLLINISILKVFAIISILDKGVSPINKKSVGIRFYMDIVNENSIGSCKVLSKVRKCCLTDLDEDDCDTMKITSETLDLIKPREKKTLVYIFPTLCPHGLVGYCSVMLDYRCPKNNDRLHLYIPFDTRINNVKRSHPNNENDLLSETLDQTFLNDCDMKYVGQRSFYDKDINKCTKVPICVGDVDKELPDVVYVPSINMCKNFEFPLTPQDIYAISTGLGTVTQANKHEDSLKVEFKSNCSTISQNLYLLRDLMYGKLCPCDKTDINYENGCKSAILSIVFCIISICAILFAFLLCVNTTVWLYNQWSRGNIEACMVRVRDKFKKTRPEHHVLHSSISRMKTEVTNNLLREIITKDIPLELRDSVVSICERMEKKLRRKKRYRCEDIGSQINLQEGNTSVLSSSSSTDTLCSEKERLIK